ncbi:PspC domain-containing protein [Nocardioides sp. WV_118_6]|uniref:PspC domain-containing protein n=1 Tax=Pimelobacter TaxID=2044 RepID=UPI001C044857|nr:MULTISPECIES: PspC domain-containing protein [Pimelobacter]MBU2698191.1 hypothetical protein [Pimelobacter sp. 30-1]UUW91390.1 PspC domain-containing protein [Pimelobacter simplex]UUW95218.1 PspC domain-containing protein [Pimelobacter simplex]
MSNYDSYPNRPASSTRRLTRRQDNKMVAGVCSGIADHFGVDPTLVRILLVAAVVFGFGTGIILYLAAWWLMPEA